MSTFKNLLISFFFSVADPFHFDTAPDPDPRIRFVETRIRLRPKIEEILPFFTFLIPITQKMIYNFLLNIENINPNEKKHLN